MALEIKKYANNLNKHTDKKKSKLDGSTKSIPRKTRGKKARRKGTKKPTFLAFLLLLPLLLN